MTKTILYDGLNIALKTGTGIATYTRNLANTAASLGYQTGVLQSVAGALPKDGRMRQVTLFDDPDLYRSPTTLNYAGYALRSPFGVNATRLDLDGFVLTDHLRSRLPQTSLYYVIPQLFRRADAHFHVYGGLMPVRTSSPIDLLHTTYSVPIHARGAANICTIHDLVPLRLPYLTRDRKRYFAKVTQRIIERADHIITVSEASRRDIISFYGLDESRITNTYQAVDVPARLRERPADAVAGDVETGYGLEPGQYLLFFGALEPKKNLMRLLEAYGMSRVDMPLVIAGPDGWLPGSESAAIASAHNEYAEHATRPFRGHGVRRLGFVSFPSLISLIRCARAVVFPSLYEGFGLPVLEAMQLGTPVLSSTGGSLPEVAGDAALLASPYDTAEIAAGLAALANDDDLCNHYRQAGPLQADKFSPARYRTRVEEVYRAVLGA